jgi:hypothetical protein
MEARQTGFTRIATKNDTERDGPALDRSPLTGPAKAFSNPGASVALRGSFAAFRVNFSPITTVIPAQAERRIHV